MKLWPQVRGLGLDAGAKIKENRCSVFFREHFLKGLGGSMRTLVDLGTIELVGKLTKVPYWQCLSLIKLILNSNVNY